MSKTNLELDLTRPEVQAEVQHLENVINRLSQTIMDLAGQKKNLTEHLVDYRKQMIEENKFDEDKPLDAFDHEMFAREESYKSVLRRINEMQDLMDSPYFGKITFSEGEGEEEIYVGKFGYIDEKLYEPIIIDWRAPIATLFYHGGLGQVIYESPAGENKADILARRQFIIKASKLLGMFDSEVEIRDEILQYVLSSNAGEKLKDIIMTIQHEQDEIIRHRPEGVAVVNGVAGSGKTTIALHRVAWLLYNYRKKLEDKVLILGPNNIFMEYISQVLPTLGETSVRQNTLVDFIMDLLDEPHLDLLPQEDFIEAISTGDQELFQDAQYKRSAKCLERMDQVVKNLETSLYKARDLEFLGQTIMSKQEMEQSMTKDFAYMPLMPRAMRIKRVIINRLRNARNEKLYDINKKYQDLENRISAGEVLNEDTSISRWEEIRNLVRQVMEFREQITYLGKGNIRRLYMAQNTMRILTHEDLVPMLYLKNRLEGIKLGFEVRYLVIDEAQDLSLNHFKVLKDITKCHNATIVGDLNQRLIQWDEAGFLQLEEIYNDVTTFQLNKSYRSTDEIVKYADGFLKGTSAESLRSGDPVEVEETKNLKTAAVLIKERYEQMKKDGVESIAIITRNLDTAQDLNNLLKDEIYYKFIRTQDGIYSTNTLLLSAFLAKGLEFDGVIMVDTHRDREKPDLVKYIMSTRALHRLHVIETTA